MKIIKYCKLKDNRYMVLFDDVEEKIYDDVIIKFDLLRKKDISKKEFDELIKYNDALDAYYKAIKYITRKIRTEKEIIKYLQKDFSKNIIDDVINKLKSEKYIDDDIYISCYVSDKLNLSNDGPNKIKKDLVFLGMKDVDVEKYINGIDNQVWLDKLKEIVSKRIKCNHRYGVNRLKEKIVYDLSNLGYYKWMIEDVFYGLDFITDDSLICKEYDKWYKKLEKKYEGKELVLQLRNKLLYKGFTYDEIDNFLQTKRN